MDGPVVLNRITICHLDPPEDGVDRDDLARYGPAVWAERDRLEHLHGRPVAVFAKPRGRNWQGLPIVMIVSFVLHPAA